MCVRMHIYCSIELHSCVGIRDTKKQKNIFDDDDETQKIFHPVLLLLLFHSSD